MYHFFTNLFFYEWPLGGVQMMMRWWWNNDEEKIVLMRIWMIRKMEMRSDEMNDETTYLWMGKRPFEDG